MMRAVVCRSCGCLLYENQQLQTLVYRKKTSESGTVSFSGNNLSLLMSDILALKSCSLLQLSSSVGGFLPPFNVFRRHFNGASGSQNLRYGGQKRTYYDILGVAKSATQKEIKDAYFRLSKEFHPDSKPGSKTATSSKFVAINEAYEVLSKPSKRLQYDMSLRYPSPQQFHRQNPYGRHREYQQPIWPPHQGYSSSYGQENDFYREYYDSFGFKTQQRRKQQPPPHTPVSQLFTVFLILILVSALVHMAQMLAARHHLRERRVKYQEMDDLATKYILEAEERKKQFSNQDLMNELVRRRAESADPKVRDSVKAVVWPPPSRDGTRRTKDSEDRKS